MDQWMGSGKKHTFSSYYYNVQSTPMVYILDRNKKLLPRNWLLKIFSRSSKITGNTSGINRFSPDPVYQVINSFKLDRMSP